MDLGSIYTYKIALLVVIVLNVFYLAYEGIPFYEENSVMVASISKYSDIHRYIIDTPGCRIENLDPFTDDIKEYVYKIKKISCRNQELLTYVTRTKEEVILNINNSLLPDYSSFKIKCCYSTIKRNATGPKPDDNLSFSDCVHFENNVTVKENFVKVECWNFFHKVYENVHSTLQPPNKTEWNTNAYSVLLVGIDGVSRSNFVRSMPRTFEFCERNNWINLKGYNKIADNTYPNLVAVLAGKNYDQATNSCDPYDAAALNRCEDFIWSRYRRRNYSTAYAEDTPKIATFNGVKAGFIAPPTDYYFRPYFLATDLLPAKYLCLKAHCTGPEKTGVRMQGLIKDFVVSIKNSTPGFGLFWMNSFSHEDVNCPTSMDDDFVQFFEEMETGQYLDDAIVIFFSDHGFRFGKIRQTHTGWVEERLPFIYVRIPRRFKEERVEEYMNLLENSEKLTTPYDVYMTLQHVLSLSDPTFQSSPSPGCPLCQSLFTPLDGNRSCAVAGIPQHYCTCSAYQPLSKHFPLVAEVAEFFVGRINEIVRSYGAVSSGCSTYFLEKISHAKALTVQAGVEENVLVGVVTNPEAIFEATVKVEYSHDGKVFTLLETNRLDRYAPKTFCVQDSPVQMYCCCKSLLKRLTNIFCNSKFCFLYNVVLLLLTRSSSTAKKNF